ncbi:MAG: winged helix-turn-helix transcriptional regulator [bacterium]|nr:winged helix-turn-helix transcriptional regulator [bacterium]
MKNTNKTDENILNLLEKTNQVMRFLMWEVAKNEKISPVQMQILLYIRDNPSSFNKVSILSKEFDLTKATISDAVSSLEEKKMVKKIKEKDDKRSSILSLTAKGKKLAEKASAWPAPMQLALKKLPTDQKEQAMLLLMNLLKSLFDDGVIGAARMCITCGNFSVEIHPGTTKPHKCNLTGKRASDKEINIGCEHHQE